MDSFLLISTRLFPRAVLWACSGTLRSQFHVDISLISQEMARFDLKLLTGEPAPSEALRLARQLLTEQAMAYWKGRAKQTWRTNVLTFALDGGATCCQVRRQGIRHELLLTVSLDHLPWPVLLATLGKVRGATPIIESLAPSDRYQVTLEVEEGARADQVIQQLVYYLGTCADSTE